MTRRKTRQIHIGQVAIGGGAPVSIQSMSTFTPTDITAAVKQINELADAGCDIVRLAVPNRASALALKQVKSQTRVPLVADNHFD